MTEEQWLQIYLNTVERGTYQQDGAKEVTLPNELELYWIEHPQVGLLDRPEMWILDAQRHPEAYPDGGRYSGAGNFNLCTGKLFLITQNIYIQPGRPVRGSCAYFQELRGTQGGARLGLIDGDGPFAGTHARQPSEEPDLAGAVIWGPWYNWSQPEKTWTVITCPPIVPASDHVRLALRFNLDYAKYGGFAYDRLLVEQLGTGPGPDPIDDTELLQSIRQIMREELDRTTLRASA